MHFEWHVAVEYLFFLASLAAIPIGIIYKMWWLLIAGIIFFFAYPILLEALVHLWALITHNEKTYANSLIQKKLQMASLPHPIVYHPDYNLSFCGLEKLHPFDSCKYRRVIDELSSGYNLINKDKLWKPKICSRAVIKTGSSNCHLFSLNYSMYTSKVIELPICFVPAVLLRHAVINPMLLMTQGTIDAAIMSLNFGFAFNIGGGFHHSSRYKSGGFCMFPDISMAIMHLRKYFGIQRSMIIDLDAHQGDGHERDFARDPDVFIVDYYNSHIYPGDFQARKSIKLDVHVGEDWKDNRYLSTMDSTIPKAIDEFKPQFILYNAGTDIATGDPLGHLGISDKGIIARDEKIFRYALTRKIPVLLVTSGGYQKKNAITIAESINNLYKVFNLASHVHTEKVIEQQ